MALSVGPRQTVSAVAVWQPGEGREAKSSLNLISPVTGYHLLEDPLVSLWTPETPLECGEGRRRSGYNVTYNNHI